MHEPTAFRQEKVNVECLLLFMIGHAQYWAVVSRRETPLSLTAFNIQSTFCRQIN